MSSVESVRNHEVVLPASVIKTVVANQENKDSKSNLDKCDNITFKEYTVKKGDNLWNISKKELDTPFKWPKIYDANKNQIKDPNLIYPKQVLRIPVCFENPQPTHPDEPVNNPPVNNEPPVNNDPVNDNPPVNNPPQVNPQPVENPQNPKKGYSIGKAALIGGVAGTAGTALTLVAITKSLQYPLSNLGGYGTAQVISSNLNKIGLGVPSGPALTQTISKIGGPKVAGAAVAVGVGLAVAGAAAGGYYIYKKIKED